MPVTVNGELTDKIIDTMVWRGIEANASDFFANTGYPFIANVDGIKYPLMDDLLTKEGARKIALFLLNNRESLFNVLRESKAIQSGCQLVNPNDRTDIRRLRYSGLNASTMLYNQVISSTARLLPKTPRTANELGIPTSLVDLVISSEKGILLIVGGTGSGKSTTMGALITSLLAHECGGKRIMSFEDPIEAMYDEVYKAMGNIITQHEVGPSAEGSDVSTYEEALHACLRSAPDVLIMGELRNNQTIIPSIAFSNTGHFLMSTLHANTAASAYARLFNSLQTDDSGSAFFDLLNEMVGVVAQKLVPKIGGGRLALLEISYNSDELKEKLIDCKSTSEVRKCINKDLELRRATFYHQAEKAYSDGLISPDELKKLKPLKRRDI